MSKVYKTAVIGVGRMGRHHARVYNEIPQSELIAVVDVDEEKAKRVADEYGCRAATSIDEIIDEVEVAIIAVPTVYHEEVARPFIERSIPCLIEKPMAQDSATAQRIMDLAAKHRCPIQIGHSERFNPVVIALRKMNVHPMFVETHRISPFTFRSADVGVTFDMMIHDIDIVLNLIKDREYETKAVGVAVLGPNEDLSNAWVEFSGGAVANLTASRLALKTERKIRVFCPDAYLSIDYAKKCGIAIKAKANLDLLKMARERDFKDLSDMQNIDFSSMVNVEELIVDDVEPLKAEATSFLDSVRIGAPPEVTAEDGLAAVKMAEAIVAAINKHGWKTEA